MKKISNFLIVILLAAGLMTPASAAAQSSALYPNRGGTGTTTIPTFGKVLIGQTNGTYGPVATSTLKINTSDLVEGSNLFYTDARSWFSITSSSTIRDYLNWWEKNTSGDISYTHGNVGIKATNPAAELVVGGTINSQLINVSSTTATSTFNGNVKIEGNLELSGLAFFTVVSSGNMSVAGNLTVTGTTEARGKVYSSTGALTLDQNGQSNGAIVLNPTSGNIGIGDTNPANKLSVTGNSYLSGNLTVTGTSALGTISSGTWGGTAIPLTKGGLGTDFSAAAGLGYFSAGTASSLNTSAALATVMTDETGSAGSLVFSVAPTFTGNTTLAGATITNSTTTNATTTNQSITALTATTGTITGLTSTNSTSTNATSTTLSVSSRATFPGSGVWTSAGNVGIGTTTPTDLLHIVTNTGSQGIKLQGNRPIIGFYDIAGTLAGSIDTLAEPIGTTRGLEFRTPGVTGELGTGDNFQLMRFNGATNKLYFGDTGSASLLQTGHNFYITANRGSAPDATAAPNLAIVSGNVGIGTTTPGAKFHVVDTNKTELTLWSSSNALISTNDAPGADIGGTLSLGGRQLSTSQQVIGFASLKGAKEGSTDGLSSGYLSFLTSLHGTGSVERMRITSTGLVGIATTTPAMKLDVYGQIRATNPTKPTCTAALRGAIQYDVSDDHFYGCRAGGWAQLDN